MRPLVLPAKPTQRNNSIVHNTTAATKVVMNITASGRWCGQLAKIASNHNTQLIQAANANTRVILMKPKMSRANYRKLVAEVAAQYPELPDSRNLAEIGEALGYDMNAIVKRLRDGSYTKIDRTVLSDLLRGTLKARN